MDVNDLMARAMEKWRAMSEPAEDDAAPAAQPADAPVSVTESQPSEEPDNEPIDEESIPNEPPEPESAAEPDLAGEDGPSERVDEPVDMPDEPESIPDEDVGYDVAEPDTGDGPVEDEEPVEFPAEPDEPWGDDSVELQPDEALTMESTARQANVKLSMPDQASSSEMQSASGEGQPDQTPVLGETFFSGLKDMIQPQFAELQTLIGETLQDQIEQQSILMDSLGAG